MKKSKCAVFCAIGFALLAAACGPGQQVPLRETGWKHPYERGLQIGSGDLLDAATTEYGLNNGFIEGNSLMADVVDHGPLVTLAVKIAAKEALVATGIATRPQAHVNISAASMGAGCANIVTLTGGATPLAAVTGLGCWWFSRKAMTNHYERDTGRMLNGNAALPRPVIEKGIFHDHRTGKKYNVPNAAGNNFTRAQIEAAIDRTYGRR